MIVVLVVGRCRTESREHRCVGERNDPLQRQPLRVAAQVRGARSSESEQQVVLESETPNRNETNHRLAHTSIDHLTNTVSRRLDREAKGIRDVLADRSLDASAFPSIRPPIKLPDK